MYVFNGSYPGTKNLAEWDEGLFTQMGPYLSLSKVVLISSEKQKNDGGSVNVLFKVKYRMLIKYDLAVLIETAKFRDDFETTIVNLYL